MTQGYLFDNDKPSYLLSIRQGSAEALMNRSKPHEFRRKFDHYEGQARVFIYVTKPTGAIIGEVVFDTPIEDTVEGLCGLLDNNGFDTADKLKSYLAECETAYALPVVSVRRFKSPVSLNEMRQKFLGFNPPMSSVRLDRHQYTRIRDFLKQRA